MDLTNSTMITPARERGQHLHLEDRFAIKIYRKLGYSLRSIASVINCSASTLLNELRRGTEKRNGNRGRFPEYSPKRGQANYMVNRTRCHKPHKIEKAAPFINWVVKQVKEQHWSFDVCVGIAKKKRLFPLGEMVCTKTLYNKLWAGNLPLTPFDVPEALSRKPKKAKIRRNKRLYGRSIEDRPEIVLERIECGHWEIDTVVGHRRGKAPVVFTLLEKTTQFYIAIKIPGKYGGRRRNRYIAAVNRVRTLQQLQRRRFHRRPAAMSALRNPIPQAHHPPCRLPGLPASARVASAYPHTNSQSITKIPQSRKLCGVFYISSRFPRLR